MAQVKADALVTMKVSGEDETIGALNRVNKTLNNTAKSVGNTTKTMDGQFRLIRGGLGQMGHQVQDIAVQLQMGQNALLVFGQQGSQIASLMGPNGAIIGAFLAVGAALGTTFLPALFESGKGIEDLTDKIEKAAQETHNLTETQLAFLAVQYAQKIEEQRDAIEASESSIERYGRQIAIATNEMELVDQGSAAFEVAQKRVGNFENKTINARAKIEDLNTELADAEGKLAIIKAGGNPFFEVENGAENAAREIEALFSKVLAIQQSSMAPQTQFGVLEQAYIDDVNALKGALNAKEIEEDQYIQTGIGRAEKYENDVLALTEKRLSSAQALIENGNATLLSMQQEADQERLNSIMASFDAEQIYINQNVENAKAKARELTEEYKQEQKKREDIAHAEQSVREQSLSALSSTVGMAASLFKEGTAAQKVAFAAQKALAVAQTIINTEAAAIAATAMPPIGLGPIAGLPYGQVIRAAGYASAAMIAGQAIGSFQGGGFTGFGARAGGLDNKGGRLAIVHPNETIIDHTKNNGSVQPTSVNVNFQITANDTKDFDRLLTERRGVIVSLINKALNDTGRSSLGRM
jgi:hypothetical protein